MKVTQKAIDAFGNILKEQGIPDSGIRIYTVQGCCSPSLQMTVTNQLEPDDNKMEVNGIAFFVDNLAKVMLEDLTIDYGINGFRLEKNVD